MWAKVKAFLGGICLVIFLVAMWLFEEDEGKDGGDDYEA